MKVEVPMRRCVGCMESKPKELVRIVYDPRQLGVGSYRKPNGRV